MAANAIDIGDAVRLSVVFKTLSTMVALDPSTVVLKVEKPDGTEVQYQYLTDGSLIKDSVGNYHLDYVVTQGGMHYYKWIGSGNMNAAEEGSFLANTSRFA